MIRSPLWWFGSGRKHVQVDDQQKRQAGKGSSKVTAVQLPGAEADNGKGKAKRKVGKWF